MKILGLSCGRRMGNSEVLLRHALDAAAASSGAEIELIRLLDLSIQPCTGCIACLVDIVQGGAGHCVRHKDDFPFIEDKIYDCDALIVSAPIYIWSQPGYLKLLCDRVGPSHDISFATCSREMNQGKTKFDERIYKERVGAFIAVGGAPKTDWTSMALPTMYQLTIPMNIQIVDQMCVLRAGNAGQIYFLPDAFARAVTLGRNIAEALAQPAPARKWLGDEQGSCPVCHCDLMVVGKTTNVECAVCGIQGTMSLKGAQVEIAFSEEEQAKSRLKYEGKRKHFQEIQEVTGEFFAVKNQLPELMKKYSSSPLKATRPPRNDQEPDTACCEGIDILAS